LSVLPVGFGSAVAGGYQIERSLRFNSADSAYLNRTLTTPTNNKIWTWSSWVKKSFVTSDKYLVTANGTTAYEFIKLSNSSSDNFEYAYWNGSAFAYQIRSTLVLRDPSAWYHIVVSVDTTQATAANRVKLYVNNVEITSFSISSYPAQNTNTQINSAIATRIGGGFAGNYFDGYMTEVNFIDGQALTPSSFGETDSATGVWEPKAFSGTYGTNGFYLKFADNSGTTSTTLGKDSSGNGNNWTPNNFSVTAGAGNDSLVDSPTAYGTDTGVGGEVRGNYCTLNPLDSKNGTASNGNLLWTATASQSDIRGTFAIPASGKWYMECTVGSTTNATSAVSFGLATSSVALDASNAVTGLYQLYASSSGFLSLNGTNVSSSLGAWTAGDVLQIAVDVDNTKMWLGKNNTWYNSSGGTTGNPSTGANATSTTSMVGLFPFSNCYQNNATWNAGQRAFAYTAPSGFKALCTQNLPTPTIGATSTTQAGKYFNPVIYAGSASQQVIDSNLSVLDLAWIKNRTTARDHVLVDTVRGGSPMLTLYSNQTYAEDNSSPNYNPTSISGSSITLGGAKLGINNAGENFVMWGWNAGGSNATNTSGTITSTVRANTTSGFSIVTYTGNGSTSPYPTVGHGLGITPKIYLVKRRGAVGNWVFWHTIVDNSLDFMYLNTTAANANSAVGTVPTSTVMTVGGVDANASGSTYVAYCFAPVAGYSAFGSYTGNGSADGPFVYTGFRPRYIMRKRTDTTAYWVVFDTARNTYNVVGEDLYPNDSLAGSNDFTMDILSNGFKIRGSGANINASSGTYIYMAFAESPFKYSLAR